MLLRNKKKGRSPSWGAWIEINSLKEIMEEYTEVAPPRGERGLKFAKGVVEGKSTCRSPSWGAWIEIARTRCRTPESRVAPPRGERGLKLH